MIIRLVSFYYNSRFAAIINELEEYDHEVLRQMIFENKQLAQTDLINFTGFNYGYFNWLKQYKPFNIALNNLLMNDLPSVRNYITSHYSESGWPQF